MTTNTVKSDLLANLHDKEYRQLFVEQHINRTVAFQTRSTREAQGLTQADLGRAAEMAQARISLLEDPNYGNFSITTLKRIARALDVALIVRFVPFSELTSWVVGERQIIQGLSPEALAVPPFMDDLALLKKRDEASAQLSRVPKTMEDMMRSSGKPAPDPQQPLSAMMTMGSAKR